MITKENYFREIEKIGVSSLDATLKDSHILLVKITKGGTDWSKYEKSEGIKEMIDLHIATINGFLSSNRKAGSKKTEPVKPNEKQVTANRPTIKPRKQKQVKKNNKTTSEFPHQNVEAIGEEVRFIKRFVGLHGKEKTPDQILSFIKSLQRAIVQKKISKTSPYVNEIREIQSKLINFYNAHHRKKSIPVELGEKLLSELAPIAGAEKVFPSVNYIKRFVGMKGQQIDTPKVDAFQRQIEKAVSSNRITKSDPYMNKIKFILKELKKYKENNEFTLSISNEELNGLMGILNGCGCVQGLDGIEDSGEGTTIKTNPSPTGIMNSMDFMKLRFEGIGFTGKWRNFIGDPSKGFTAMVFGKPKFGKSYLCVDFAGYLARNHGKVLYVAKEEELDQTLQMKLNDKSVAHPNLDVSDYLPKNVSGYDYIFLDSVTRLGLNPEDLHKLEKVNPGTSFIYIFQVRKDGVFRGRNDFQHDVDVVVEVPEKGIAVQNGRYNQGGEMKIFEDSIN